MSDARTSIKTGADGKITLGQPMLFECMGISVLSLEHGREMRGYLVYVLIVKNLIPLILFKLSHSIIDWTALSWIFFGGGGGGEGGLKHF